MKFQIDGDEFTLVQRPTFGQARMIENEAGIPFSSMTELDSLQALVWLSMRPTRPDLKFSDLDEMDIPDLSEAVEEATATKAGPTAGARAGAKK